MKISVLYPWTIIFLTFISSFKGYGQQKIGGQVFHDEKHYSYYYSNEQSLAGIKIELLDATFNIARDINGAKINPITTDSTGKFSFSNLKNNVDHYLRYVPTDKWIISKEGDFSFSNYSKFQSNGYTRKIRNSKSDMNLGLYRKTKLNGRVWIETDDDGFYESDESFIEYPCISLCKWNGSSCEFVSKQRMKDSFLFDVDPGKYEIYIDTSEFKEGAHFFNLKACSYSWWNFLKDTIENNSYNFENSVRIDLDITSYTNDSTRTIFADFCMTQKCLHPPIISATQCDLVKDTICNFKLLEPGCHKMNEDTIVGVSPFTLCPDGGIASNMTWLAFIAGSGDYEIVIKPSICVIGTGNPGFQAGIYRDCSFSESVYCNSNCIQEVDTLAISSKYLIPGSLNYFFIDGCNRSVCEYQIRVLGDYHEYSIPSPTHIKVLDKNEEKICINESIRIQLDTLYNKVAVKFKWRIITPLEDTTYKTSFTPILDSIFLDKVGIWRIACIGISNKCQSIDTTIEKSIIVHPSPGNEDFGIIKTCSSNKELIHQFLESKDVNSDGDFGLNVEVPSFVDGLNSFNTFSNTGCSYKQEFIIEPAIGPQIEILSVLCKDQLPFTIDSLGYTFNQGVTNDTFLINAKKLDYCYNIYNANIYIIDSLPVMTIDTLRHDSILLELKLENAWNFVNDIKIKWTINGNTYYTSKNQKLSLPHYTSGNVKAEVSSILNGELCSVEAVEYLLYSNLTSGRKWLVDYSSFGFPITSFRYFFFSDTSTTVSGKEYFQMMYHDFNDNSNIKPTGAFYRFEEAKTWVLFDNKDYLIEDYSLKVGDTMSSAFVPAGGVDFVIIDIDTVTMLNGQKRIHQKYKCAHDDNGSVWEMIEGVSSLRALFSQRESCSLFDPTDSKIIRCYYENNDLVYMAVDECIKVGTSEDQRLTLNIYPNPGNERITISLNENDLKTITISNLLGQIVYTNNFDNTSQSIDISSLPSGQYLIFVLDGKGRKWQAKWVKL